MEILQWIFEAYTSKVVGHFKEDVVESLSICLLAKDAYQCISIYMRLCSMQHTGAFQQKIRLIFNIACTSRPWESISMDFLSGLPKTKFGYDYLFVVVDHFQEDGDSYSMQEDHYWSSYVVFPTWAKTFLLAYIDYFVQR